MNTQVTLKLIDLLITGIHVAPTVLATYKKQRDVINAMLAEGREPTIDEWNTLLDEIQQSTDVLNS